MNSRYGSSVDTAAFRGLIYRWILIISYTPRRRSASSTSQAGTAGDKANLQPSFKKLNDSMLKENLHPIQSDSRMFLFGWIPAFVTSPDQFIL